MLFKPNNTVLFQGDSITDANRSRWTTQANALKAMGNGYAALCAEALLKKHSDKNLAVYNRGISGNKVYQLTERWQKDCLSLQPSLLSILIGVNDYWHMVDGKYNGTLQIYETDLDQLVAGTKRALPDSTIVLCEPFILPCGVVTDQWLHEFPAYQQAAKRIAQHHQTVWVPFQDLFNHQIAEGMKPHDLASDGVHPTELGHKLMSETWLEVVEAM